jgi:2-hydroxy-3-keto-5-methylthiopentenyl-1-phosphate phosphatase
MRRAYAVCFLTGVRHRSLLPYLARLGLDLPVTCNRLQPAGERRWSIGFPPPPENCTGGSGVCKCRVLQPHRHTVLIGDGLSDFCIAGRANFVLAKGALARHCSEKGIPHLAISGFADALVWLGQQADFPPAV